MPLTLADIQSNFGPNNYSSSFRMDPTLLDFLSGQRDKMFQNVLQLAQTPTAKLQEQRHEYETPGAAQMEAARQFNEDLRLRQEQQRRAIAQQNLENYYRRFQQPLSPEHSMAQLRALGLPTSAPAKGGANAFDVTMEFLQKNPNFFSQIKTLPSGF